MRARRRWAIGVGDCIVVDAGAVEGDAAFAGKRGDASLDRT